MLASWSGPRARRAVIRRAFSGTSRAVLLLFGAFWGFPALGEPLDYYEWIAVAPTVVAGESLGDDGKYVSFRVQHVLRGTAEPGGTIRVFLRRVNRERDRELHPRAVRLDVGESYVLLLRELPHEKQSAPASYELVRGVGGARALPAEGADAVLSALKTFVDVQETGGEDVWRHLRSMLEETEPILIGTALQLHRKFRRGDLEMLVAVRPLLDHPQSELREQAARLIEQILERFGGSAVPEPDRLQSEIASHARRDSSPAVRIAATHALGRLAGESVLTILDGIAEDDPDQRVRYAAETLAYERRHGPN